MGTEDLAPLVSVLIFSVMLGVIFVAVLEYSRLKRSSSVSKKNVVRPTVRFI